MLEIEDKLKDPKYKENLLRSLYNELQEMKKYINSGLSPDDYKNYSKYLGAIDSSISVLNKYKA